MIEYKFENLTDAAVIDAIGEAARAESAAVARRFALIGALGGRTQLRHTCSRLYGKRACEHKQ